MAKKSEPVSARGAVAIAKAAPLEFDVDGRKYAIRPPTPEEYDEATFIEDVVRKQTMARPEIKRLKSLPNSDEDRANLESSLAEFKKQFAEMQDGRQKRLMASRIAWAQRELDERTLADEVANERAIVARDRWCVAHLLLDDKGAQVFDSEDSNFEDIWADNEYCPYQVKEQARVHVWISLRRIDSAPLPWEPQPEPSAA